MLIRVNYESRNYYRSCCCYNRLPGCRRDHQKAQGRGLMNEVKKRPQDKWDEKNGLVSKSYKINKQVAEEYKAACEKAGVSMGVQLTELMKKFIEQQK